MTTEPEKAWQLGVDYGHQIADQTLADAALDRRLDQTIDNARYISERTTQGDFPSGFDGYPWGIVQGIAEDLDAKGVLHSGPADS